MYCNNCGEKVRDGAAFCPSCGCRISNKGNESAAHNSSSFSGIDIEAVKMKAKDVANSAVETASDIKEKSAEKLEELNVSVAANKAVEKTKGVFGWYSYNWSRVFKKGWKEIELKHHLIWCGAHLAVLLVIATAIGTGSSGGRAAKSVTYNDTVVDNVQDDGNGLGKSLSEVVSQIQGDGNDQEEIEDKSAAEELLDSAKETANDIGNEIDYATKVLFSSLYGTWTNSSGTFTLTIGKDGTVKIADSTGTFGADAFTYTEVDDDTVRLKVASENFLANMLSIDMDYYVSGETLTVSALGNSYELTRKK